MKIGKNLENIFSLKNKIVVLTGATGGIGAALAKGLAGVGAVMLLCDMDEVKVTELQEEIVAEGGLAKGYGLNLLQMHSIKTCVEEMITDYERIDVLINCAGINKREGFLDVEEETFDRIMDINLKGLYFLTQQVVRYMSQQKNGNIINMGSHNAFGMLGGCSVYGASKSAVVALTRSMAIEWAKFNIRANCICPGHIITPLTTVTWEHPERSQYLKERIAMERPGTPEEILGLTIMLASDASSYMSGMAYHIDGGCLAGGTPWPYDTKY